MVGTSLGRPSGFSVGEGATILGASRIKIGRGFSAGSHLWLEAVLFHRGTQYQPRIEIGNSVTVGDLVRISANSHVRIGDDVLMGSKIFISDHSHGDYRALSGDPRISPHERQLSAGRGVWIGDKVWIGESVTILPGVRIGDGCVIGANSVVTFDIPPLSIAAGSPATVRKQFDPKAEVWRSVAHEGRDTDP